MATRAGTPLRHQHRRTRVPEIRESALADARLREQALEVMGDVHSLKRPPLEGREDESRLLPPVAGGEPFRRLASAMRPQRRRDEAQQRQHPTTARGLGLHQERPPADALERPAHGEDTAVEVEILPQQAQQLSTPQTAGQRRQVHRLQALSAQHLQQRPRLNRRQRLDLRHRPAGAQPREHAGLGGSSRPEQQRA